jgi:hypothetical protein
MTKLKPCVAALLLALLAAVPAWAQSGDGDEDSRRDVTIGNSTSNSGGMRSGVNERGDNEMVIEPKPKKQQAPDMGPIYVYPLVNQGGTPGVRPVPVPPPQAGPGRIPQGQPQGPFPGQPNPGGGPSGP